MASNARNLTDLTYLQAYDIKLLDKCPPRGALGAIEMNRTERHQQDNISNETNGKVKID